MIIPVRCWSCGKPIAQNWEKYKKEVKKGKKANKVLDSLGLEKYCCRSIFLTHVDLMGEIKKFKK